MNRVTENLKLARAFAVRSFVLARLSFVVLNAEMIRLLFFKISSLSLSKTRLAHIGHQSHSDFPATIPAAISVALRLLASKNSLWDCHGGNYFILKKSPI